MSPLQVRQVDFGSPDHLRSVQLRREVLRWPLGLDITDSDLEAERDQLVFVGTQQDAVVATLNYSVVEPRVFKMRQVAVAPGLQGRGIGRQIVERSESLVRALGAESIVLHARTTAVPFYVALGYELMGDLFEEVGIPHQAMQKRLNR